MHFYGRNGADFGQGNREYITGWIGDRPMANQVKEVLNDKFILSKVAHEILLFFILTSLDQTL